MYKILIIEDDPVIAGIIQKHLVSWEYEARCISNFKNVLTEFSEFEPHLVLIDISLPFYSGYYWCSQIRKVSKTPVIFVSSASDNMNIVTAMDMGADDFIAKPFDLDVLSAKVRALLRRSYDFTASVNLIEHRGVMLNISDAALFFKGEKIELTKNEYRILKVLMENRGRIQSRDTLMQRLWETDNYVDENTLTVNVTRIRRKLENAGISDFITTKRGLGYIVE